MKQVQAAKQNANKIHQAGGWGGIGKHKQKPLTRKSVIHYTFFFLSTRCMLAAATYSSSAATAFKLSSLFTDGWPSATYQKFSWIGHYGPCFPIRGEQVLVLTEPTQFYEVLKVMNEY